ncbi:hypothetical protein [Pseudomonas sp. MPB26]|uniref:hypothetical protein n=1 Tax=Pseudomonas sp. MPB26 TaxID=3388491 RepID=UPI0039849865
MTMQFDPELSYELYYDVDLLGVVRKGVYYEGPDAWEAGEIRDGTFYYNGRAAGTVEALIVTRTDPKPVTALKLVPIAE